MAANTAIFYTSRSKSEKDLGAMISHLQTCLGANAKSIELSADRLNDFSPYQVLVFCGYDHITLAHLNLALDLTPTSTTIVWYDEPGASIDRELNSVLFRGMDAGRIPPASVSRIVNSWSYQDIVAISKQRLLESPDGSGTVQPTGKTVSSRPTSRLPKANPRARQVEDNRDTQARDGDGDIETLLSQD